MLQLYYAKLGMFYEKNTPLSLTEGLFQVPALLPIPGRRIIEMSGAARPPGAAIEMRRGRLESCSQLASAFLVLLPNMAQSVNITELNLPQLEMLKNQLDQVRTNSRDTPFPPHIPSALRTLSLPSPPFVPTSGGFLSHAKPPPLLWR